MCCKYLFFPNIVRQFLNWHKNNQNPNNMGINLLKIVSIYCSDKSGKKEILSACTHKYPNNISEILSGHQVSANQRIPAINLRQKIYKFRGVYSF